jgi:hypothetical protein
MQSGGVTRLTIRQRLLKAVSLEIEFFGGWKAIIYGSIPGVYWLIRRLSRFRIGEILALGLAYAIAALAVFVWKLLAAEQQVKEEQAKLANYGRA